MEIQSQLPRLFRPGGGPEMEKDHDGVMNWLQGSAGGHCSCPLPLFPFCGSAGNYNLVGRSVGIHYIKGNRNGARLEILCLEIIISKEEQSEFPLKVWMVLK